VKTPLQAWQSFIGAEKLPTDLIDSMIPLQFMIVEPGFIEVRTMADERHLLPSRIAHGGTAATILDTVTAGAIHTTLDMGFRAVTTDLSVKFITGIPPGKQLIARATLVNKSKRLGISEGKLFDEDGVLYAIATATCMIVENRNMA
jgi:uncharacterized protein (TIGR00369 family)